MNLVQSTSTSTSSVVLNETQRFLTHGSGLSWHAQIGLINPRGLDSIWTEDCTGFIIEYFTVKMKPHWFLKAVLVHMLEFKLVVW